MTTTLKLLTTGKVFGDVAKALGFVGKGVTRFIEYPTYYLVVNHQKSSYGKNFYINLAIYYKEMLGKPLEEHDIAGTFKVHSTVCPHVTLRLSRCPTVSSDLQEEFDRLVKEERMDELREVLLDALQKMLAFMQDNHDRKTIRRLYDARELAAIVLKEV